jgi:hypothetical protein
MVGMTPEQARDVPWLAGMSEIGEGGWSWPRWSTSRHPAAVGSFGVEAIGRIEAWSGRPLWPWQRLVLLRALEHDRQQRLVWRVVGLSVPRQHGKSTLVGELAGWRLRSSHRFGGGPQHILHVARDLGAAVTLQRPHRLRAEQDPDKYKTRSGGGRLEVEWLADNSLWLLRSSDGVYSYSASMCIADECWDIGSSTVDDGLAPCLLQAVSPQLWLVSTANNKATSLMLGRRAAGLAELDEPESTLWLEWSAPPGADPADVDVWRRASPVWSSDVSDVYAERYRTALATRASDPTAPDPVAAFTSQYLNMWPASVEPARRGEPLIPIDEWASLEQDVVVRGQPIVVAVDEHPDGGCAVAWAADVGAGLHVEIVASDVSRSEAWRTVASLQELAPNSRVIAVPSLASTRQASKLRVYATQGRDLPAGLALLRSLVAERGVSHHDSGPLTEQLATARVTPGRTGQLGLVPGSRVEVLRAAVWALRSQHAAPPKRPAIY